MTLKKELKNKKGSASSPWMAEIVAYLKGLEKDNPNDAKLGAIMRSEIKDLVN